MWIKPGLDIVSTRSRPKAADPITLISAGAISVSTRSRPKAADHATGMAGDVYRRFNTQPPEGG